MTTAAKPRPATLNTLSGHCRSGAVETLPDGRMRHPSCPGAGDSGVGTTWFCTCECHLVVPMCRYCRQTDVELTLDGYCIDTEGCEGAIVRRQQANPIWQQLQQLRQETQQREAQKAAERAAVRQAARRQAEAQAKAGGRPASPRAVRVPKAPPTPQRCHCGCGKLTKGGRFFPGHDMKLKSALLPLAREGSVEAAAELIAREWLKRALPAAQHKKADELVDALGPDILIQQIVEKRYALASGTNTMKQSKRGRSSRP